MECDASIMDGISGSFGAVGAVPGFLFASFELIRKKISLHWCSGDFWTSGRFSFLFYCTNCV